MRCVSGRVEVSTDSSRDGEGFHSRMVGDAALAP